MSKPSNTNKSKDTFTKADYIRYLKCPRELWLRKNQPEVIPSLTSTQLHYIEQGNVIDQLAQNLFNNDTFKRAQGIEKAKVSFQKEARHNGLVTRTDVFAEFEDGRSWLFEVKAASKVKDELVEDVVFQKIVFEQAGYHIEKCFLVYINTKYTAQAKVNLTELLKVSDISERVSHKIQKAVRLIPEIRAFIKGPCPQQSTPFYCKPLKKCFCYKDPSQQLPDYSVFKISRLSSGKLDALLEKNILDIKDVPKDFKLSKLQRMQVDVAQSDTTFIDKEKIENWLHELKYPLYFLDYETFAYAIPFQTGVKAHQQAVFQYSLHVQKSPDSEIEHHEYLLKSKDEPVEKLVKHLHKHLGNTGSVVVWNKSFEKTRNKEMGERYPEYAHFFQSVNERMKDLEVPFKKKWYIHPLFKGKSSIKSVLPVLAPKYDYTELSVSSGTEANVQWHRMTSEGLDMDEYEQIYNALLAYCKLDTLAMVEILRQLR